MKPCLYKYFAIALQYCGIEYLDHNFWGMEILGVSIFKLKF